jgi:hypothetical protein
MAAPGAEVASAAEPKDPMSTSVRVLRALTTACAAGLAWLLLPVLLAPVPAGAHPFGDPQRATIAVDGPVVEVTWSAAADDLTSLAMALDVLPGLRRQVFKDGALVPEESRAEDAVLLAEAPGFEAYLLHHVRVSGDGQECAGQLVDAEALTTEGATLAFTCSDEPARLTVGLDTLTDLHPAYRTMATGPDGSSFVYAVDSPEHEFDVAGADGLASAQRGGLLVAGLGLAGVLVLGGGSLLVRRARRRDA